MSGPDAPISVQAAREIVLGELAPLPAEPVALGESLRRVSAAPCVTETSLPPFDSSAMDGYALRSEDTAEAGRALTIAGESRAGHPARRGPAAGEAVRISTGAMIPPGADAVLRIEDAQERDGRLLPGRRLAAGENVRRAGEDLHGGAVALAAGTRIGPAELGLLAAAGRAEIDCVRRPRVTVLSSGDELVAPGLPLRPGQIHDSNSWTLAAQVRQAGGVAVDGGALPDDMDESRRRLADLLGAGAGGRDGGGEGGRGGSDVPDSPGGPESPDAVVIAGGVSVGRHDHVKAALRDLGVRERFWAVALRPGGPTWFGTLAGGGRGRPVLVFGLPGNPVSAMVTFRLFAHPALLALSGLDSERGRAVAVLAADYRKPAGRAHYLRCRLRSEDGVLSAHLTRAEQGSHLITSMVGADALAAIPAEREHVRAGERVEIELL